MEDNFIPSDYILGGFDYIGIEIELWNEKQVKRWGITTVVGQFIRRNNY